MELQSSAFAAGGPIPARHTCDGEDLSPPLAWSGVPPGARSLALLCDDPDAPAGIWHHWAVLDMPPETTGLEEGLAATAGIDGWRQAINDFGRHGYGGPCPPRGHGPHRYRFRLLALDVARLEVARAARCSDVERAASPHVIAEATLIGTYER